MFAPRADDLGLDAGRSYTYNKASVNSTDGISYKAKVCTASFVVLPPSLKYSADAIYFGESLSYMAERFLLGAIIIELKWSLEADTLPPWPRSGDPVLDRSKKLRDESRMSEKLHDRAKMNRLLGSDILC